MGINGKLRANFGAIVILALGVSVISGLPFFRFDYYEVYVSTYHLTNTQMGVFGTVIGVFGIVSYLFGGVVADGDAGKEDYCGISISNGNWWLFASFASWI